MSPEKAHHFTVASFRFLLAIPLIGSLSRKFFSLKDQRLETVVAGIKFPNPVGLAAGFDKDGKYFETMGALGFGFVEIGTVTPKGQDGNPQPRLFRLPADNGLINRMGFNNEGVDALLSRLSPKKKYPFVVGGNIGKNKLTPNENAVDDYAICFEALFDYVDYFVVNVSSPNTPGLRDLQEKAPLLALLGHLQGLNQAKSNPKPIFLKIAPDLTDGQLDDIVDIIKSSGTDGVIATNTTISRANLKTSDKEIEAIGNGGLSGQPVRERATAVIQYLHDKSGGSFPIIAVGGIASGADALEKLNAGASLVQVYSGLIYEGPMLIKNINKYLLKNR